MSAKPGAGNGDAQDGSQKLAQPAADDGPSVAKRTARRQRCDRCLRAACICPVLNQPGVPVRCAVQLLVLQHPRELHEPKGSARLLHLAVANSVLLVGEAWPEAPADLPPDHETAADPPDMARRSVLLYPPTPGQADLPLPPAMPADWLLQPDRLRLVVLDGTWRKSQRMLHQSPWLQSLPRLSLVNPAPSRYALRRARGLDQRSTFEAAVLALQSLGPEVAASVAPLWPVFDAFVAQVLLQQQAPQRA